MGQFKIQNNQELTNKNVSLWRKGKQDIKKYYERNNEYWKEKEKSKKYVKVLEEYYALKEKVTDDDIELLNDLDEINKIV